VQKKRRKGKKPTNPKTESLKVSELPTIKNLNNFPKKIYTYVTEHINSF